MKVSIITACFNSMPWIVDTYNSITSQTFTDWEWIITDDCSSDGTYEFLLDVASKDSRVQVYRNSTNSGAAASRNNSIGHSTGKFLAFIDSDDVWLPEKLGQQIEFMGDDIHFSFTAYELIDSEGARLGKTVDTSNMGRFSYEDMLKKKATMGCSTVMLRREYFPDVMMPLVRTGQDYALWLKLLRSGACAYVVNDLLTQYRILPNSISRNKLKKARRQWMIYRKLEKLGFLKSLYCFFYYARNAVFRKA